LMIAALGLVSQIHVCSSQFTPTGTYRAPTFPGMCKISLKSWGYVDSDDSKNSYIKVNGVTYFDSFSANFGYRGFNLVTLDTETCKASNFGHWDTHQIPGDANGLAAYINGQPDGTHILGVISDSATYTSLGASAVAALNSIGVDVPGLALQDKVLFHAVKGEPAKTFSRMGKKGGGSVYYDEKPGVCDVSMKSWGYIDNGDSKNSYIKVNGVSYMDSMSANFGYRGFNLIILDTSTCKASNFGHWDTHQVPTEANALAAYINGQPDGAHILGVISDSATYTSLGVSAVSALQSIGVDVNGLRLQDKVLFHAVKGRPQETFAQKDRAGGGSIYLEEKAVCKNGGILTIDRVAGYYQCVCASDKYYGDFCEQVEDSWLYK